MNKRKAICLVAFISMLASSTMYSLSINTRNNTHKKIKCVCSKHKKKVVSVGASLIIPAFLYVLYKCLTHEQKDDSSPSLKRTENPLFDNEFTLQKNEYKLKEPKQKISQL